MRLAKTLTALLLILAMTGNLAALPSCAEQCALARHAGSSAHHPAQPMAESHHSAHHPGMGARAAAQPGTPGSVERQACSGHLQDAAARGPFAPSPGASITGLLAQIPAATVHQGVAEAEAATSPPPGPHLHPALPLRI